MVLGNISRNMAIDPDSVSREEAKEISREVSEFMDYIVDYYDLEVIGEEATEEIHVR